MTPLQISAENPDLCFHAKTCTLETEFFFFLPSEAAFSPQARPTGVHHCVYHGHDQQMLL